MESLSLFHAALLGLVEGVTEFLPVSSTGHLILVSRLLGIPQTEFIKTFEIAIQLGAILAVVVLYGRMLFRNREAMKRIAASFIPTALVGFALYRAIKQVLLGDERVVLFALAGVGLLIILFERFHKESAGAVGALESISYPRAFAIGLFQAFAVIPGVSRSGATILGGMLMGVSRRTIVEFSFLLAVPTMCAAAGLDIIKSYGTFSAANMPFLATGFIVSFAVAIAGIKFFLRFIQKHSFAAFGAYRIALAALFWIFVL